MARTERYGTRDLTYSMWHRGIEPVTENMLPYIDIDAVEYCQLCKEPLALLETARDVGQVFKATTVLRKLAERAVLPAYLVLYRKDNNGNIDRFRIQQVYPRFTEFRVLSPDEYADFLRRLRMEHSCIGSI